MPGPSAVSDLRAPWCPRSGSAPAVGRGPPAPRADRSGRGAGRTRRAAGSTRSLCRCRRCWSARPAPRAARERPGTRARRRRAPRGSAAASPGSVGPRLARLPGRIEPVGVQSVWGVRPRTKVLIDWCVLAPFITDRCGGVRPWAHLALVVVDGGEYRRSAL